MGTRVMETVRLIAFSLVVGRWAVFGVVVGFVEFAWSPIEVELVLSYAVFEPMVTHIKCFGAFHADSGSEDVMCSGVVSLKGGAGGGLRMAHFFQGNFDGHGLLGTKEQSTSFSFSCGGGVVVDMSLRK